MRLPLIKCIIPENVISGVKKKNTSTAASPIVSPTVRGVLEPTCRETLELFRAGSRT